MATAHLWMAAEVLTEVIRRRRMVATGLDPGAKVAKDKYAESIGFPRTGAGSRHLSNAAAKMRKEDIFEGDEELHGELKKVSEGLEHGFADFDALRASAERIAVPVSRLVRRAILRESGIPDSAAIFESKLDEPLCIWDPATQIEGVYGDTSTAEGPGWTPETLTQAWPEFYGLEVRGGITEVVDDEESTKRTLKMRLHGDAHALTPTQNATVQKSRWIIPGIASDPDGETEESDIDITVTRKHDDIG